MTCNSRYFIQNSMKRNIQILIEQSLKKDYFPTLIFHDISKYNLRSMVHDLTAAIFVPGKR